MAVSDTRIQHSENKMHPIAFVVTGAVSLLAFASRGFFSRLYIALYI